jgi:hypothetical protein
MDVKDICLTSEPYLQIEPQHLWHGDAIIQGNESGLRKLAAALLKAADATAETSHTYFASDGEGYDIIILHEEKPSAFREPFYTLNVECPNPEHHKRQSQK